MVRFTVVAVLAALLSCCPAVSQDSTSASPTAAAPILDKPQGNKKYFAIAGKVRPPVAIQTPQPAEVQAKAGKPKFVGTTVIKFGISEEGTVDWVRVVRSCSIKSLDDKAVAAVRSWTFRPATKDGLPVPVETNAEVNFKLY